MNTPINKEVWFSHWGQLYHGSVMNLEKAPDINDTILYVKTDVGVLPARASNCFASLEDCMNHENDVLRKKINNYKKNIRSKDDLIRFLFSHQVYGEDYDDAALTAAQEKADEFSVKL